MTGCGVPAAGHHTTNGNVPEWSKGPASKAVQLDASPARGFESFSVSSIYQIAHGTGTLASIYTIDAETVPQAKPETMTEAQQMIFIAGVLEDVIRTHTGPSEQLDDLHSARLLAKLILEVSPPPMTSDTIDRIWEKCKPDHQSFARAIEKDLRRDHEWPRRRFG